MTKYETLKKENQQLKSALSLTKAIIESHKDYEKDLKQKKEVHLHLHLGE